MTKLILSVMIGALYASMIWALCVLDLHKEVRAILMIFTYVGMSIFVFFLVTYNDQ
jgi:hypothetical protein